MKSGSKCACTVNSSLSFSTYTKGFQKKISLPKLSLQGKHLSSSQHCLELGLRTDAELEGKAAVYLAKPSLAGCGDLFCHTRHLQHLQINMDIILTCTRNHRYSPAEFMFLHCKTVAVLGKKHTFTGQQSEGAITQIFLL